ncbi:Type VI secretion lipoprotein [compost metagenome]
MNLAMPGLCRSVASRRGLSRWMSRLGFPCLWGFALAVALAGPSLAYAQFSHPREQTKLDITVTAEAGVNPDDKGRAAPIMVRIYELKSEATFESADYFSLHDSDKTVMGADLLVRDEFILRPGEVKKIRRMSHPELAAIGVIAGYRELAQSEWRLVQKVDPAPEAAWYRTVIPANKVKLEIALQGKGIQLTPIK